jgi:hypothetical protein
MPKSRIWHAPEWHHRAFRPENAKKMDIFSFGMVCLWMIFDMGISPGSTGDDRPLISFDAECDPETNCLEIWKTDDEEDKLTLWAASIVPESMGPKQDDILLFFKLALVKEPDKRELDINRLLQLLNPDQYLFGRSINLSRLMSPLTPPRYVYNGK